MGEMGSNESLTVTSPDPVVLVVVPEETTRGRVQSDVSVLEKQQGPCVVLCQRCGCTARDGCITVAAAAILIGFGSLLGIYMCPSKFSCRSAYYHKDYYENYPGSFKKGAPCVPPKLQEQKSEKVRRMKICGPIVDLYIISASLFVLVTAAAGFLLLVAVSRRRSCFALVSAALFALGVVLVVVQMAPIYFLGIVRFREDIEERDADNHPFHSKPVEAFLPLWAQRAFSVLGGVLFGIIYLFFALYSFLVRQDLIGNKGSPAARSKEHL